MHGDPTFDTAGMQAFYGSACYINELAPVYGDVDGSGFRLSIAENSDCR